MNSDFHLDSAPPEFNPYAAPTADIGIIPQPGSDAEVARHFYLKHETNIKSIGLLYLIPGVLVSIGAIAALATGGGTIEGTVLGGLGVLFISVGIYVRKLRRWTMVPIAMLSGIGLIGFPFGTLINGYILWLIFCAKGRYVMSGEYQEIIAATPHIKYKTSKIVVILAAVLFAVLGIGIAFAFFGRMVM